MKLIFMNDIGVNLDSANLMSFYFLKEYYSYEVWDLSPIFEVEGAIKNIEEAERISSISIFKERLAELVKSEQIVIITNMVEAPWRKLAPIAKSYTVPVICTQKNNFFDILRNKIALDFSIKVNWKYRVGYIIWRYRLTRSLYNLLTHKNVKYDYLISAYNSKPETVRHFVRAHNVKYDEYLTNKNSENIVGQKYILFIDSALCYHPIDFSKPDPNWDSDIYIGQLNHYFELLEQKYKMPVVISLHPVTYGRITQETFNGRQITYPKTAHLIQHCEFVLSHYSTSLINTVLAKKSAVIISSEQIEHSLRKRQQSWAFAFAKYCDFALDSLDTPGLPEVSVNAEKYEKFIKKYLVDTTRLDKSNSQIMLELLRSIENN